jgi:amidase
MLPLHFQSATRLAQQIGAGTLGARELLEHCLSRVDALNPRLNAIVQQDRERARARADAADAALARGERWGPLHGVPFTVKESFDVTGLPTTFGFEALAAHRATSDAVAVQRLAGAGAVLFGKTNVPEALADFQSYNALYGTTENPWRQGCTPGGSSGGSAAALAAGLTALEMGSDIGGSIRNPAHFCGVFGHKPTYGLLPPRGHTIHDGLAFPDLAVVGPLARSAADLAQMVDLLAQPDAIEARGLRVRLPLLQEPTSALRVAVWSDDAMCPVSAAVGARLQAVVDALAAAGARIDTRARPVADAAAAHRLYDDLLQSAMAVNLSDEAMAAAVARARGLDATDTSAPARVTRAQAMYRRDWARLNEARTQLRWAWHRFFEQHDVLLAPIMPVTAFAHDHRRFGQRTMQVDGVDRPYFDATFWAGLATAAYLPATLIPAGPASDGLPVGVQIIGPAYGDQRTIGLARRLEALGFAFVPPPALA